MNKPFCRSREVIKVADVNRISIVELGKTRYGGKPCKMP
jgi:hypothetical protein